jgi:SAM-dependent methyltransferase
LTDPTQRFSSRVENYARYRPGYPGEVLDLLRQRCGLTKNAEIADVGSGTGALARLFLENGNRVFGVEPNPETRRAGERLLRRYGRFTSVAARAEDTALPESSVDLVTAGQAFHWFDPGPTHREFARILKPGGYVALVWNTRRKEGEPFLAGYEELLHTYGTDYREVYHGRRGSPESIRGFFRPDPVEEATLENRQPFDFEGLRGRLLSSSYVPDEGEPGHPELMEAARRLFEEHQTDRTVVLEYDTQIFVGPLSGA